MLRAIGLGFAIVVTHGLIALAGLPLYGFEFALMVATVVGVGLVVARAGGERLFLKAAVVSSVTALCMQAFAYIELIRSPALSLMMGAMTGAVALGLRSRHHAPTGTRR